VPVHGLFPWYGMRDGFYCRSPAVIRVFEPHMFVSRWWRIENEASLS
jgi:hypothetical protein